MKDLPVKISLSGKQVMVIGSTQKAYELVRYLSEYADRLTMLSSSPDEEIRKFCLAHHVRLLEKPYRREELYGMDYVFSAPVSVQEITDIAAICRTMGIFLYTAGRPDKSDFALQAPRDF